MPIAVGRLTGKKQCALSWRRKRSHGVHAIHRYVAVGPTCKRVGMPIVGVSASQRFLNSATRQTQHFRECVKRLIDNRVLGLVD